MPDVFMPEKRSAVMALIRGKGTRDTELRLVALFGAYGIHGWRRGQPLFGKPDFVFYRARVVIFVDGCFWHGCPKPNHAPLPKSRAEWWAAKLGRNRTRDRLVTRTLRADGCLGVRPCPKTLAAGESQNSAGFEQDAILGFQAAIGEASSAAVSLQSHRDDVATLQANFLLRRFGNRIAGLL